MSSFESRVTILENDTQNTTESINANINKSKQSNRLCENLSRDDEKKDDADGEIPLYIISKGENEKQKKKEYIVAYNVGPPQQAPPQTPYPSYPMRNFAGGGGAMGPPLDYDPETRNGFVKLVLSLVLFMLIITASFIVLVLVTPEIKDFFQTSGMMLALLAMGVLLGVNYAITCSACARYPPCNYVMLILTVLSMSTIAAQITSHYKTEIVLYATIATAAVVFVCVLLAFSRFDFTSWMLYVVVIATAFSVLAMIVLFSMLITGHTMKPLLLVILIIATLIEVVMLTIELQTVIGGRTVELSEDDYALGAFLIYTSIVSIFLKIVQILGILDDS